MGFPIGRPGEAGLVPRARGNSDRAVPCNVRVSRLHSRIPEALFECEWALGATRANGSHLLTDFRYQR